MTEDGPRWSDQDIRNALLDMLSSAERPSDLRDYVLNSRIEQAESAISEQEAQAEEQEIYDDASRYGIEPYEVDGFKDYLEKTGEEISRLSEDDISEIISTFADRISKEEQDRDQAAAEPLPTEADKLNITTYEQNRGNGEMGGQSVARRVQGEVEGGAAEVQGQGSPADAEANSGQRSSAEGTGDSSVAVVSGDDVAGGTPEGSVGRRTDNQGNLIDKEGKLVVEKINSLEELSDNDFTTPSRSVELPNIQRNVRDAIGAGEKPIIIKKNIFEKNKRDHADLTPEQSRAILSSALYSPELYGQNRKETKPYNWVVINTKDEDGKNRLV